MQNKGAIRLLALLMAVVCLYQLSFSIATWRIEKAAKTYAQGDFKKEMNYLDSMGSEVAYNFFYLRQYTYKECVDREIILGLDLKGGMNVILEVQVADVLKALSNYSTDPVFTQAISKAKERQKTNSRADFLTLFGEAFEEIDPNAKLVSIFNTVDLRDRLSFSATNKEVLDFLRAESEIAVNNSFNIIRSRIDRFGVVSPNVQRLEGTGRILVEMPGVTEPERVRKLLQGTANLQFWETYENSEVYPSFVEVNTKLAEILQQNSGAAPADTTAPAAPETAPAAEMAATLADSASQAAADTASLLAQLGSGNTLADSLAAVADSKKSYPLFSILSPSVSGDQLIPGSVVGLAHYRDTAQVSAYLNDPRLRSLLPRDLFFLWSAKAYSMDKTGSYYELHALKRSGRDGRPPLDGGVVTNASANYSQMGGSNAEVSMSMNPEGSKIWARITRDNVEKCVAIVLDDRVYSAPRVNQEIKGGSSQITGNFTLAEATDLANILKSGKMPAGAQILQDEVVGPTLGKESVKAGFISFLGAIAVVLIYLAFYYSTAGIVADIAMLVNMFFLMGVMASVGVVLTLPGIAGIVLTIGMADDANVIIFERIREELRAGKTLRTAIADGYSNAYSAIIDGQVTTLLTGIILFSVGVGPIKGFATTLVLGIITSLFCSIFVTRLIFDWMVDNGKTPKFSIPATAKIFLNAKFDFIGVRKRLYGVSIAVIMVGIVSIFVQGFNWGIDFSGGRSYMVAFPQTVETTDLRDNLSAFLPESSVEVKTFGGNNQVKITTDYLIDAEGEAVDRDVEKQIFEGCKTLLPEGATLESFRADNILNSQKVGPTMADDIQRKAILAVILSLVGIFLYIFIRFRNWQYGLGAIISVVHDVAVLVSLYSILYKFVPFSLEIDQNFIGAVLTVIGYSINDTVIIYDRIREYNTLYPKRTSKDLFNGAMNSTLGRTMNTSLTTILVLLVIFIWGGEVIRGFSFAMMVGIIIGTYSSVFNAAPIVFDLMQIKKQRESLKLRLK